MGMKLIVSLTINLLYYTKTVLKELRSFLDIYFLFLAGKKDGNVCFTVKRLNKNYTMSKLMLINCDILNKAFEAW